MIFISVYYNSDIRNMSFRATVERRLLFLCLYLHQRIYVSVSCVGGGAVLDGLDWAAVDARAALTAGVLGPDRLVVLELYYLLRAVAFA